jgi:hypothetical protein
MVCQPYSAFIGAHLSYQLLYQDGLSTAGLTDDRNELPAANREIHSSKHMMVAK